MGMCCNALKARTGAVAMRNGGGLHLRCLLNLELVLLVDVCENEFKLVDMILQKMGYV